MSTRFEIPSEGQLHELLPARVSLFGEQKVGKTSFAAKFPSPILIQAEDGAAGIPVPKMPDTPCQSWDEIIQCLRVLLKEDHDRKTLIIDTLDKAETLAQKYILEDFFKGDKAKYMHFYKGPIMAGEMFNTLLFALDHLHKSKNMNIVLIAHDGLQNGANALGDDFKKFAPRLSKYAWGPVRDWVDQIGHVSSEFRVIDGKAKEVGKDRWIHFRGSPGRDAGCRAGYEMPEKIKLDFDEYAKHMKGKLNGI